MQRCFKCMITLNSLSEKKICDYLIKVVREDGKEDYICPICNQGWN